MIEDLINRITADPATSILVAFGLLVVVLLLRSGRPHRPRRLHRKIRVGTLNRSYIVHFPPDMDDRKDWRLLIAYHPALATASYMEQQTRLHSTEGSEEFIVVYPDGFSRTWNAGTCCGPAMRQGIDDLGFFDAIVDDIRSMAGIRDKVYVSGFSNGALMAYYLLCQRSEQVAAIATFAAYLPPKTLAEYKGDRVPLMHIHGTEDQGAPVKGGMTSYLGDLPPAIDTVEAIARRNGCDVTKPRKIPVPELDCVGIQYVGKDKDSEASLFVVPGLGHVWPGSDINISGFGPSRPDLDGSKVMLEFFLNH